jgi:DNA-binding CsgD family transcriptional regulator
MYLRAVHGKVIVHLLSGNFGSAVSESKKLLFLVQGSNFSYAEGWSWYFHSNVSFQSFNVNETELALKKTLSFEGRLHYRVYFDALSGLILTSALKGDKESTISFLNQMSQLATSLNDSKFQDYFDSIKARVSWHFGQGEKELGWALHDWVNVHTGKYLFLIDVPDLTKLRVIVSHGSNQLVEEAIEVLSTLEASLNKIHNNYHTIDIALLKGIAAFRLGNKVLAENSIEKALLLANSTEMIRPILEVHHVFPALFNLIRSSSESFHVLARLGLNKPTATLNPGKLNLEELTVREQEIAKLIANGLRNKEIADQLYISEVTVKSHLTNIYRKLDVSNRTSMLRILGNQSKIN